MYPISLTVSSTVLVHRTDLCVFDRDIGRGFLQAYSLKVFKGFLPQGCGGGTQRPQPMPITSG